MRGDGDGAARLKARGMLSLEGIVNLANENVALSPREREHMLEQAGIALQNLFASLRIDTEADHNMQGSAHRIAKMLVNEIFAGRYEPRPKITTFPNTRNANDLYTVGPIAVRSTCSHHFAPVIGNCWIGLIAGDQLIGLSKLSRIVDWIMRRPQLQEEATVQIAEELDSIIRPKGLGVIVKARHMCLEWRGVCEHETMMTTTAMRGRFAEDEKARNDLMALIH